MNLKKPRSHDLRGISTNLAPPYSPTMLMGLNHPKNYVIYEDQEAQWEGVTEMILELRRASGVGLEHQRIYWNAFHILALRTRFRNRVATGILDAMKLSGHALETDPRDKIFALLGLCHNGPTYVPLPNYKQSLETVITDTIRTIMITDHSLDIMCLKGCDLRAWSQITSLDENEEELFQRMKSGTLESTSEDFETFINTLERILLSGMRLTHFKAPLWSVKPGAKYPGFGMVHPDGKSGDYNYFVQGCSIPVVLRLSEVVDSYNFLVIGWVYVLEADKKFNGYASLSNAWDETTLELEYTIKILELIR